MTHPFDPWLKTTKYSYNPLVLLGKLTMLVINADSYSIKMACHVSDIDFSEALFDAYGYPHPIYIQIDLFIVFA